MKFFLQRYKNNPILKPRKNISWEAKAVFNPGVVWDKENGVYHMLIRTYPEIFEQLKPAEFNL